MKITTKITGLDEQIKALKKAQRMVTAEAGKIMRKTAREVAVPEVREIASRNVPAKFRNGATVKAVPSRNYVYITATKSRAGKVVGLLNWGGKVKSPILPRKGRSLIINGRHVKSVKTVRVYTAKGFLEQAATQLKEPFTEALHKELSREMKVVIER